MVEGNRVQLRARRVVSEDRNVVEGNRVQLRARRVVSEDRNVVEGNRVQSRVGSPGEKKSQILDCRFVSFNRKSPRSIIIATWFDQ